MESKVITMNGKFVQPSDADVTDLQAIFAVGPTRARRLSGDCPYNDLDVVSIRQLAELSIDELTQVRSIGVETATRIKGSAQGWINQRERNQEEYFEQHRGFDEVEVTTSSGPNRRRVAVFSDDRGGTDNTGAFQIIAKQYGEEVVHQVIDDALSQAEISLTEETTVGWAKNSGDGGRFVQSWYDMKSATGDTLFKHKRFDTPWAKYRRHLEPMSCVTDRFADRDDVETIDDVPPEHRPDRLKPSDVPFPFIEQPSDLTWSTQSEKSKIWALAPMERRQEMCEWADQVVILVDSGGGDSIRKSARVAGTPCTTAFDLQVTSDGVAGIKEHDPDGDYDTFEPDPEHQVANQRDDSSKPVDESDIKEGPEKDDAFIDGAFAQVDEDSRLDTDDVAKADPGGRGLGSKKDAYF